MSDKPTELSSTQVQKLTGLSRSKLRFWTDGRVLNIRPSVASGRQGATSLFSLGDYYALCLAQHAALGKWSTFAAIGTAVDAIMKHNDWPRWEQNRGEIQAKIFADGSVVLQYAPRVKGGSGQDARHWDANGDLEYLGLLRVLENVMSRKNRTGKPEQSKPEQAAVCHILVFDLKAILGEADQRLAKVLA